MIEPIYIINSHIDYSGPLSVLLDSMRSIPNSRKLIYVAGCTEARLFEHEGVLFHYVTHNSFDYTGLIELVDRPALLGGWRTHFFCLQDTMELGSNADALIGETDESKWTTAVFGGQCNLVLYSAGYLMRQKPFIDSMRNCSKKQSVEFEGELWRRCPEPYRAVYPHSHIEVKTNVQSPYGQSSATRIQEYYRRVDIVKWKANWGQNMEAMVMKP